MVSSKHRRRLTVLVLIILLLLGGVLGVTISYFQDSTGVVKNTFAGGALFNNPVKDFTLVEQKIEEAALGSATKYQLAAGIDNGFQYTILPGVNIPKRPYITVDTLLMDAYLYVLVDTAGAFAMNAGNNRLWESKQDGQVVVCWEISSDWKLLRTLSNGKAVYYYVGANTNGRLPAGTYSDIDIMKQNDGYSIEVDEKYNSKNDAGNFNIHFTAYICQMANNSTIFTVGEAWTANFAAEVGN